MSRIVASCILPAARWISFRLLARLRAWQAQGKFSTSTGTRLPVVVPLPSPKDPQHFAAPAAVSAQERSIPAVMAATPLSKPVTATGTKRLVVVPSPSWPPKFFPQHLTAPAVVSAHVWYCPAPIATTPLSKPVTATGARLLVVVPLPS